MGELSDRLDQIHIHASVQNGAVSATLRRRDHVTVEFAPGHYQRVPEHELERQLAQLARLLAARRDAEYRAAWSALADADIRESTPIGRRDHEFETGRKSLTAEGRSADGRLAISVRGGTDWTVSIQPGALDTLDQTQFSDAVAQAATAVISDQLTRGRALAVAAFA